LAKPVGQPGPVALLEDAAHLLRRASLETLLCHWVGSVPLAVVLISFWMQATHPPVNDAALAAEALAAALLLIWMSCWRSVFAGRISRQLSGAANSAWSPGRIRRLIENQALLAATKPLMLLIALAAGFPFAKTVTFYRYAPVLADREQLDAVSLIAKARQLSRGNSLRTWIVQALLILLGLILFVNVAVTFIALPQLFRLLTGQETAFTRGGPGFFVGQLFLLSVVGATWLLFDPYVQTVYCLACFQAESVETGEDLRAGLRRIRSMTVAAVLAVLMVIPAVARADDSVRPAELEQALRRQMQSPEYNWRIPPPESAGSQAPWIIAATDRAIQAVQAAVRWAGKMIEDILRWIFGGFRLSPLPLGGVAPGAALHWSIQLLMLLAAALLGLLVWRAFRMRRKKAGQSAHPAPAPVRMEDEDLLASRLAESEWLELGERYLAEGNLRFALRSFYLATLAWLGRVQLLAIHPGKTNREFEVELRRKARQSPAAQELFSANVRAFERAWYGLHDVLEQDTSEFRRRSEEMKSHLDRRVAL
jgi:hypothetical protein